jgi:hypothetical protein
VPWREIASPRFYNQNLGIVAVMVGQGFYQVADLGTAVAQADI